MPQDTMPPESEVRLTESTFVELESRIAAAVHKGLGDAMTEENATKFWLAGINALQRHATENTGKLVLGGLASLLRRGVVFILLGALVYALGGWTAIATFWKALFFVK